MCTVTEESILNKRVSLESVQLYTGGFRRAWKARDPSITFSRGDALFASPPVLGTAR